MSSLPDNLKPGYVEPRTTDLQHATLQEHVERCDQCRKAVEKGPPRGFGQRSRMCAEYIQLQRYWADGKMLDSTTE